MALKRIIDKLEDVEEKFRDLYVAKDGKFVLDAEAEDVSGLKNALDAEKEERRRIKEERDALKAEKDAAAAEQQRLRDEAARSSGNVKDLEESWKTKLKDAEEKFKLKVKNLVGVITNSMVGGIAGVMATEISTAPKLMEKEVRSRLTVEFDENDVPTLRVLDPAGKVSAMTVDELKKEFVDSPDYSAIIIGSRATGGGSNGTAPPGGSGSKWAEMDEVARAKLLKDNPEEFRRLSQANAPTF